jgi:predicted alpha-1,6-mannanase (GH76 family)
MIIEGTNPGGFATLSDVQVRAGYMYFRGTDNAVWRVNATNPGDCTNFGGPGVISTRSNVYPADDEHIYFCGTDGKVWRMSTVQPHNPSALGNFTAQSDVLAANGYVYFRGTDNAVWQVNATNPGDCTNFGGPAVVGAESRVYPADDGYLYFRGTDGKAWRLNSSPPHDHSIPGNFTAVSAAFAAGGAMYLQGTDHLVWRYSFQAGTLADYAAAAAIALQDWYDGQAGLWLIPTEPNMPDTTGWWNSANALYALIDYMSNTHTTSYANVIENTFERNSGANFLNQFYDDEGWWALAWINAYDFAADPVRKQNYLAMAKTIFEDMTKGWDSQTFGGGVIWQKGTQSMNSIENELFIAVAVRLYQRTSGAERAQYSDWLQRAGQWFYDRFVNVPSAQHLIYDGIVSSPSDPSGYVFHEQTYTYTQGVIIGALADMAAENIDLARQNALTVATQIANAATSRLAQNGVLTEFGAAEVGISPDGAQFKGIFMRNLAYLAARVGAPGNNSYVNFIERNSHSVLLNSRNSMNQFGFRWQGPFDQADAVRQISALEALNAAMRVGVTTPLCPN